MAEVVIFGAGQVARLARCYFDRDSGHQVAGFTVDGEYLKGDELDGLPLVAFEHVAERFPPQRYHMFVAISYSRMNRLRAARFEGSKKMGYRLVSYVSSRATYLSDVACGENCFVLENNTIQPFVRIGSNVTLWSGNHIGHHSVIEDHCFVSSHVVVSGNCRIGSYSFLGVNSTIRDGVTVAPRTLVGAGAVILADTRPGDVYHGPRAVLGSRSSDEVEL